MANRGRHVFVKEARQALKHLMKLHIALYVLNWCEDNRLADV